jgi:membrane protein DedA with SNARE-associated domain
VALAVLVVVLVAIVELEPIGTIELEEAEGPWPYIAVVVLIFGDEVIALLPGETTLNTASTLSAVGGVTWSIYICSVAYLVGTALVESPVAAIAVSAVASSVVVAVGFVVLARGIRRRRSGG